MDIFSMIFTGFGLSMDCFAVAVTSGVVSKKTSIRNILLPSLSFGFFQSLMFFAGWALGLGVRHYIAAYDHWLAFLLLGLIGVKMIHESFSVEKRGEEDSILNIPTLIALSIATSIDSLAVGLSFSLLNASVAAPALVIGSVTFLVSALGVVLGRRVGHFFEGRIEIAGGIILIGIGIKILIEHLF